MITRNATSRTLIIHSVAQYDALQVEHYRQQIRTLIEEGYVHVIFDFDQTEYINSSALGMLVEFHNTLVRMQGTFRMLNCSGDIRKLLHQTQLDRLLLSSEFEDPSENSLPHFDQIHAAMSKEILLLTQIKDLVEDVLRMDDPLEIGKAILEGLVTVVAARRGVMFYLSQNEERFTLTHWIDLDEDPKKPTITEYPLKFDKMEYEILRSKDVVVRQLADNDENPAHHLLHALGFRNLLASPITGHLRQYGFVCVESEDNVHLQIARPLLRTLTDLCGLALEKAALLQQVNLQRDEMADTVQRLRRSSSALQSAGQLAALGTVVSGLGHQMNNKLVPVLGYLQMLQQQKDIPEGVKHKLTIIRTASEEIQQIVQKLVQVSGMRTFSHSRIDPAERLGVALSLFEQQIEQQRIRIQMEGFEQSRVKLDGDPNLFLQALIAILHRAISSFAADASMRNLRIIASIEQENLRLVFEDNGEAPDASDREETLEPLGTFDELVRGRIFNYTIPRSIIRRHKGNLTVEQANGGGKCVTIDLPLRESSSAE